MSIRTVLPLYRLAFSLPRQLSTSLVLRKEKKYPPRTPLDESDITEAFLKGTGPGGQKINKTSSAVQLIHAPTGIVVKCQATRSRDQNRKLARRLLSDRIEEATLGDDARTRVKGREAAKKKSSAVKKSKRKYRRLAEDAANAKSSEQPDDSSRRDTSRPDLSGPEDTPIHDTAAPRDTSGHDSSGPGTATQSSPRRPDVGR